MLSACVGSKPDAGRRTGTGELSFKPTSHELWVIDERLNFAQYFSSDVSFGEMAKAYESEDRPDLLIFDRVLGLRQSDLASKILLVEFKRPGRRSMVTMRTLNFR